MSNSNTDTGDTGAAVFSSGSSDQLGLPPPREALITTAVNFLQNDKIRHCALPQKQKFLRSKGLRSDEIQIACERAGVFSLDPNSTVINMGISTGGQYQLAQSPSNTFGRIKEILHSMALVGSISYAIFMFYKRFIEPLLFGKKKKKSVEDTIREMDKKVETQIRDLRNEVVQIKENVASNLQQDNITRELHSFKSDLDAIKGLLLNRKQFATPMPSVPPSIPAWQLTSHHHDSHHSEADRNDDAGSGSGSSETEVVTKNSDSSLEIM